MIDMIARKKLLNEIMKYDFVLDELTLFLDTHPNNKQALDMFYDCQTNRDKLTEEFNKLYGPLVPSVDKNAETWEWVKGPWPWENE